MLRAYLRRANGSSALLTKLCRRLAIPLAVLSGLLLTAVPASAAQTHVFQFTFSGEGEAPAPLSAPAGLAVDDSTGPNQGDVYVADGNVVDRFDPAGKYLSQITGSETVLGSLSNPRRLALDQSSGDLYVPNAGSSVIDKFDSSGKVVKSFGAEGQLSGATTPQGTFKALQAIAVDPNTGELYVASFNSEFIDVFDSTGKYLRQFPAKARVLGIAIDSQGNLFFASMAGTEVYVAATGQLNPAYGQGAGLLDPSESGAVAVDPASDDVYVNDFVNQAADQNARVVEYNKTGALLASFGSAHVSSASRGLGVGDAAGRIYATKIPNGGSEEANVAVFDRALVPLPTPITAEATELAPTSATLNGTVDPEGKAVTECFFEYGKTAAYGQTAPCEPAAAAIGAGTAAVAVHADIAGLTAATVYHYRLVAANANGPEHGADQIFGEPPHIEVTSSSLITSSAAELRAQIDPGGVAASYHFEYSTDPGFAAATSVPVPDGGVPAAPVGSATASASRAGSYVIELANPSGSFPLGDTVTGNGIPPGTVIIGAPSSHGLYLSKSVPPTLHAITITVFPAVSQSISGLTPETTYYYRLVVANSAAPGGVVGPTKALTTHSTNLDAALPDERAYELVSPSLKSTGGGVFSFILVGAEGHGGALKDWAIQATEDGAAITYAGEGFFQSPAVEEGSPNDYTSFRGLAGWSTRNTTGEEPEEAFAPLPPPVVPPAPVLPPSATASAQVVEQSADGSLVFFTDTGKLTPESTAAAGEPDLYRYDVEAEQITDLTVDPNAGQHADVQGVLGVGGEGAAAGSYVYFVADGVLAANKVDNGTGEEEAQAGQPNLYLLHAGATTFITALLPVDDEFKEVFFGTETNLEAHDWTSRRSDRTAEVSPDGRYLALAAFEELTAQPAAGLQVFRYDAETHSLLCASCNPDGSTSPAAILLHPVAAGGSRQHYIANDGRLFFNDEGALSPRDVNGHIDVYGFEDAGTGTCATPGGCRSLISGGGGTGDSYLAAVSAEGNDVFFTSNQRLSSEDRDESLDMYDARVGGRTPPEPEIPCQTGESCHGPVPPPPAAQTAGSATFHGPPNPVEKPCKKGFVRKGPKCVKKHAKQHHKSKRHHKRASRNGGGGK